MTDPPICAQGHDHHPTTLTEVRLGEPHLWSDYPPIPERFASAWEIEVFDASPLEQRPGYCPAFGPVQQTLLTHHLWEPPETIAMLCAMERWPNAVVNDLGANIGYYTTMAAQMGHEALAYEPDMDAFDILIRNRDRCGGKILLLPGEYPHDMDARWPTLLSRGGSIIVKIDIEGDEPEALVRMTDQIDDIVFIMVEVTPAWGNYQSMLRYYNENGFNLALVPAKSYPPARFNDLDDLDWRRFDDLWDEVLGYDQSTVLLARM